MKIKFESDLHIDFGHGYIPNLKDVDVYCIAGDLAELKNCFNFIIKLAEKYPNTDIIYINGNHTFYHSYIEKADIFFSGIEAVHKNFHYLNNNSVIINGIRFIGSTLWTSLNNRSPIDMYDAGSSMNDFRLIRYKNGALKFTPEYSTTLHKIAKEYIFKTLNESKEPCVVITHHKPFLNSNNFLDSAYGTELRGEIADCNNKPIIWASGHSHTFHDFIDDKTRYLCNPLGYPHENNTGFNRDLVVNIDE